MTLEQAAIGLMVGLVCAYLLWQWLTGDVAEQIDRSKSVDFMDLRGRNRK